MHNHPSGDPTRSRADIQMTQAILEQKLAWPLGLWRFPDPIAGSTVGLPPPRSDAP
jgi:hypothetical protein